MSDLLTRAKKFAKEAHDGTNHLYDGQPYYDLHVEKYVMKWALRFIHLIPKECQEIVLAGVSCHDVEEDCRKTYNDIKKATNERVANLVHAVTNEKGKVRSERANAKYYSGILAEKFAIFIKLADRLGNVEYSMTHGDPATRQNSMYRKEYDHFKEALYKDYHYAEMWYELDKMILTQDELNELTLGSIVRVKEENSDFLWKHDNYVVIEVRTSLVILDAFSGMKQFMTFVDVFNIRDMTTIKNVEVNSKIRFA